MNKSEKQAYIGACGQAEVMPDDCPFCGGWLHRVQQAGFEGPHGWRFCEPDCITEQIEYEARRAEADHLNVRDLLCECEVCRRHGLPTAAMRAEYAAYRAGAVR